MNWFILIPAISAALYCTLALIIIMNDRRSRGGNWISLNGMNTFLATFPGAILFEALGRFEYKKISHVALSLLITTALIYGLVLLLMHAAAALLNKF